MSVKNSKKKEFSIYSGINSFDKGSYEREAQLLLELGVDVRKFKNEYNPLQLAEIRKGIADKVDVNKYLNPKLSWLEMEEMRLEMRQGFDMSSYREQGFDTQQVFQIRKGLVNKIDVSVYARKDYLAEQMREIRKGLAISPDFPIIFYMDPAFDYMQMREIRKGLEAQLDVSDYAYVDVPYMKMRVIRESAEDGLFFDKEKIHKYHYGILDQLHKAFKDNININKYIQSGYDAEQLEEICIGIKEVLDLDKYISPDMRSDAIKEVRLGLEKGLPVEEYADSCFNWQQMHEMRLGLENQINISLYSNPLYWADQMREIRLGLEDGLDVSQYSSFMYTAKDMRRIRGQMLSGEFYEKSLVNEFTENAEDDGSKKANLLGQMLANKKSFLSVECGQMLGYMTLPPKARKSVYTPEIIMKFLEKCNIKSTIDQKTIENLLSHPGEKVLIATGIDAVDGTNGYYEYCFDRDNSFGFIENEDGSIDCSRLDAVNRVNVGSVVAVYHKATAGSDGSDIFGNVIPAKRGHEIPVLRGEGFMVMNDRVTYVAKYKGILSYSESEINITKLTVMSEVKLTDKIVRVDGSLLVTGDVESGSEIHATGDVIISGHVTSSFITSGGNVIIKGGATCPVRGGIEAAGNVSAKYLERVSVKAQNVYANAIVNCDIAAKEKVKIVGKDGVLYGGTLQTSFGLEAANVGSKGGAKTTINLGLSTEFQVDYRNLQKELLRKEEELNTLRAEKERLQEIGAVSSREQMQWKIKISAATSVKEHQIEDIKKKLRLMDVTIENSNNATAVITEQLFNGVTFIMSGVAHKIENYIKLEEPFTISVDTMEEMIV